MDHKTWLWRKKSADRSIIATDNVKFYSKGKNEEVQNDKAELQKNIEDLNDKLSFALSECTAKDSLIKEHEKNAQEAIAGCKKRGAEMVSVKQELDRTLRQKEDCEDRVAQLESALKECVQQLCFVKEQQERRIQDAAIKFSAEFDKSQSVLEEKLAETSKRLDKVGTENITKAILVKEALVEKLNSQKVQFEAEVSALMSRLESMEKDNGSLKYNVHVLEKKIQIQNEERIFNCRTAEASHRQHLDNVKKITKLESECQRLRLLVRKRLPGPAAFAKMKSEVEMLGRNSIDTRRRSFNSNLTTLSYEMSVDRSPDPSKKKIDILNEQLCSVEEENKLLKEALNKKIYELQVSRIMYAQTASKLSHTGLEVKESSGSCPVMEKKISYLMSDEVSQTSISDMYSDDKASYADSWASAMISEPEHFNNEKHRGSSSCQSIVASDINLMDDFLEMEKLALVRVDKLSAVSQTSSDIVNVNIRPLESKGGEIVSLSGSTTGMNKLNEDIIPIDKSGAELPGWLHNILEVIMEQTRIIQKNPKEILDDVCLVLGSVSKQNARKVEFAARDNPNKSDIRCSSGSNNENPSDVPKVKYISNGVPSVDCSSTEKADLSKYISKVIELIEGISLPSFGYDDLETSSKNSGRFLSYENSQMSTGYMVRVFQWKTSELHAVLEQFVHTCYDLSSGKTDLRKFTQELSSALEWILNHCFSLQDVSCMKDAIIKHFDLEETCSESEAEAVIVGPSSDADKFFLSLPMSTAFYQRSNFSQLDNFNSDLEIENRKLREGLSSTESDKKESQCQFQSMTNESESLKCQIREREATISRLQMELDDLQKSNKMTQNQVESHRSMNEHLHTQLVAAKAELKEAQQKLLSLQVELENKSNVCEELESRCLELQLQLESVAEKGTRNCDHRQEENQIRNDWEITAASEKLAECQETILNLGKQLKALAPPGESVIFDKLICPPSDSLETTSTTALVPASILPKKKTRNQRSSLLDQMLAEDGKALKSLNTKENLDGVEHLDDDTGVQSLAFVPAKKKSGRSLWKRILRRKSNKKMHLRSPPLPNKSS